MGDSSQLSNLANPGLAKEVHEGRKMVNRNIKLMLRAFNGECDSAIAKVRWNNIKVMEQRIERAFDAINKLGEPTKIYIDRRYLNLKLKELYCVHEHEDKKQQEREEQRQIREEMREEERAQREIERAQMEAQREEDRYEKALEKARAEASAAQGQQLDKLNARIAILQEQLDEAHARMERAKSMAEMTKSGYVYIISNIGSFGEDVYKIGMTRRLEPMDRVRELGDASVPFTFDVHGMIYSEDAPGLENRLHRQFADRRINLVNMRKEFFRVSLEEIEQYAQKEQLELELTAAAEAREFRETLAKLKKQLNKPDEEEEELTITASFPEDI